MLRHQWYQHLQNVVQIFVLRKHISLIILSIVSNVIQNETHTKLIFLFFSTLQSIANIVPRVLSSGNWEYSAARRPSPHSRSWSIVWEITKYKNVLSKYPSVEVAVHLQVDEKSHWILRGSIAGKQNKRAVYFVSGPSLFSRKIKLALLIFTFPRCLFIFKQIATNVSKITKILYTGN